MKNKKFLIILLSLLTIFIVQNISAVETHFLFWSFSTPRALLIFFVFLIGVATGWMAKSTNKTNH